MPAESPNPLARRAGLLWGCAFLVSLFWLDLLPPANNMLEIPCIPNKKAPGCSPGAFI